MTIKINNIILWCRSYSEYVKFFNLTDNDLKKKILSSADGASSFNPEGTLKGHNIISHDPIYKYSIKDIQKMITSSCEHIYALIQKNKDDYIWKRFKNPEELKEHRLSSMQKFLTDFSHSNSKNRYIDGELPNLPFENDSFDLALVSHFLFLYSGKLSLEFHIASIENIMMKSKELRIFPLASNLEGNQPDYLGKILQHLKNLNFSIQIKKVDYHFTKGSNKMLKINR